MILDSTPFNNMPSLERWPLNPRPWKFPKCLFRPHLTSLWP